MHNRVAVRKAVNSKVAVVEKKAVVKANSGKTVAKQLRVRNRTKMVGEKRRILLCLVACLSETNSYLYH